MCVCEYNISTQTIVSEFIYLHTHHTTHACRCHSPSTPESSSMARPPLLAANAAASPNLITVLTHNHERGLRKRRETVNLVLKKQSTPTTSPGSCNLEWVIQTAFSVLQMSQKIQLHCGQQHYMGRLGKSNNSCLPMRITR